MAKAKVLLVGSGAREHAIADALVAGGAEVYAYMGLHNPGIKKASNKYTIGKPDDTAAAVKFAKENSVELAVIGPELPLAAGMADELEKAGVGCVGPTKMHAQLETSKGFTRQLLKKYAIEGCPEFMIFDNGNRGGIKAYLEKLGEYVVKPDGLTGGKGVMVFGEHLHSHQQSLDYCNEILGTHPAVVVEEKLEGEEFSLQTLTDGNGGFMHFPVVQDHKRAFDGDIGGNTGGMGSYSDSNHLLPFLASADVEDAKKITEKAAAAIKKELGTPYRGVMYGGFMKTANGIKLLEYNARFGDPEAMNVLPLLKANFLEICKAVVDGRLAKMKVEFEKKAAVCKYVVPEGYPDNPIPGRIDVPTVEKDCIKALTFYAAVEEREDWIYTTKSRGVAFVGLADTIAAAEKIAEEAAAMVKGRVFHRKDIGTWQLVQKRVDHINLLVGKTKLQQLYAPKTGPMRIAAMMSGTGSNLRRILELQERLRKEGKELFKVVMIFSDTADENVSNARKIAEEYKISYYCNDIREYYRKKGKSDRKDMKIREDYDNETAKLIRICKADMVALCGYMSIVTRPIIGNFLTVNVHPADLRLRDSTGRRKYAGLGGSDCVKKAIVEGENEIRATTHVVTEEVDAGQLLLVSKPVKLPGIVGGQLDDSARQYQEKLKQEGDWKIYPKTIRMLAEGRLAVDKQGNVYLDGKAIPEGVEME